MQGMREELIKAELNQYIEKMLDKQLTRRPRHKTKSQGIVAQGQERNISRIMHS